MENRVSTVFFWRDTYIFVSWEKDGMILLIFDSVLKKISCPMTSHLPFHGEDSGTVYQKGKLQCEGLNSLWIDSDNRGGETERISPHGPRNRDVLLWEEDPMPVIASLDDLKAAQRDLQEAENLDELKAAFRKWRRIGWKNICKLWLQERTPEQLKGESGEWSINLSYLLHTIYDWTCH